MHYLKEPKPAAKYEAYVWFGGSAFEEAARSHTTM
jgi:hypothetical protein